MYWPKPKDRHDELLLGFIHSEYSPLSARRCPWCYGVPVGIRMLASKYGKDAKHLSNLCKEIDAVGVNVEGRTAVWEWGHTPRERPISKKYFIKCWLNRWPIFENKEVWIIEVKTKKEIEKEGLWRAIGQVFGYKTLFEDDWPSAKVVGLGIVCEDSDELGEYACQKLGIRIWKIE